MAAVPDMVNYKLTMEEIMWFAMKAGFSTTRTMHGVPEHGVAAAIAMGESGGKVAALNDNASTGDYSIGLWQINMLGDLRKERQAIILQWLGESDFPIETDRAVDKALAKPWINARMAHVIFQQAGNKFTPWSVFRHGTYRVYLGRAKLAVGREHPPTKLGIPEEDWREDGSPENEEPLQGPFGDDPGGLISLGNQIDDIVALLSFFTDSKNWARVGLFAAGGLIVLVGLVGLAKRSGIAEDVVKAIPAGKALRKVAPK